MGEGEWQRCHIPVRTTAMMWEQDKERREGGTKGGRRCWVHGSDEERENQKKPEVATNGSKEEKVMVWTYLAETSEPR